MPHLPPLNALKAFEAAARHLNFRLAAAELNVTQGAVAQQVRGLEAALQVVLFERHARGLSLTEEGRRYFTPVNRAITLIVEATEELSPGPVIVTVSVTPSFASKWLVPRLGILTEDHPDLEVKIDASDRIANFQSDGVDIAVREGKPPFGPGLTADLLFPLDVAAVCSPDLVSGPTPLREPADLIHQTLLHDTHGLWPIYLEQIADYPIAAAKTLKFSQTALTIDAAIAGQGVALAAAPLVEDDITAGRLVRPFEVPLTSELGYYIVAARQPRNPAPTNRVREWLFTQRKPL